MGTVRQLRFRPEAVTLGDASAAYLATIDHEESRQTWRAYGVTLRALQAGLGDVQLAELADVAVTGWFTGRWSGSAPGTWNRHLAALRSVFRYWDDQGWLPAGIPAQGLRQRRRPAGRSRALSRTDIRQLLGREDIALREKALWRMLYESAARAHEILALDVEDLDLANRKAKVRRKGGAADVITWQTGTARLLPRLLKGRKSGPVFLTDRKARVQLPPADLDPASGRARLSYRQAHGLFKAAAGGATLHQLRHSALTHAAEEGASTSTLLAYSGHTSVASLARYARVSPEALAHWQAQRDPANRR